MVYLIMYVHVHVRVWHYYCKYTCTHVHAIIVRVSARARKSEFVLIIFSHLLLPSSGYIWIYKANTKLAPSLIDT